MRRQVRKNAYWKSDEYRLEVVTGPCLLAYDGPMSDQRYYALILPYGARQDMLPFFWEYVEAAELAATYWDDDDGRMPIRGIDRGNEFGCATFLFDDDDALAEFVSNLQGVASRDDGVGEAALDLREQILAKLS